MLGRFKPARYPRFLKRGQWADRFALFLPIEMSKVALPHEYLVSVNLWCEATCPDNLCRENLVMETGMYGEKNVLGSSGRLARTLDKRLMTGSLTPDAPSTERRSIRCEDGFALKGPAAAPGVSFG